MNSGDGFTRIVRNIGWQSTEKLFRILSGLFVGLWIARYLGPEQFGNFSYIMSWLGIFNAIAWLGVGEAAIRDMVRDRSEEGRILGSALMIRLCGSFLAIALALGTAKSIGSFDESQLTLLAILCVGVPFVEAPAGILIWFASHTNIKPAVIGRIIAIFFGAFLKIGVILTGAGLIALMTAVALESVVVGFCMIIAYLWYGENFLRWRFDIRHALKMLITGLPIVLSGLVMSVNARVDQLLLGHLATMSDVGIYAAAMRFSEIWWVVPPMIVLTLAPRYIYPIDLGDQLQGNVARIISGMALLSLIPCLFVSLIGADVISLILGNQYSGANHVLIIHIWTAVLVFIDTPVNQYLLATHRQSLLVLKSIVLLLFNFVLCICLIPLYGPQGAAAATLISQAVTVLMLPILYKPMRDLNSIYRHAFSEVPFLLTYCLRFTSKRHKAK
jgi:PST family polysaccharide transporter